MNATVKCDSDGDGLAETDASDEGLESVIVPIIFGIIFVVGFIGRAATSCVASVTGLLSLTSSVLVCLVSTGAVCPLVSPMCTVLHQAVMQL